MNIRGAVRQDLSMPRTSMPSWDGARLRELRHDSGLTLAQLAARAGLALSQVKRYSHGGATPPPQALVQLAAALNVKTTDLVPLSPTPDLTEYRWHAGLQLVALAERLGLSRDYVGEIARGAVPITDPGRWAEVLGISPEQVAAAWDESRRHLMGDGE
jgi:transcriptional regulator with XRE-family HTH domain